MNHLHLHTKTLPDDRIHKDRTLAKCARSARHPLLLLLSGYAVQLFALWLDAVA